MIELPLKHPELFRKLGIEPPKGVLLHGYPGTGKTLLAKAVANETNAHFISVNAPAIMCVSGDTKILTNPKGGEKISDIFVEASENGKILNNTGGMTIIELKKPKTVFSLDKNLKIKRGRITHITKIKARSYYVKTSLGTGVVCSANHPFACMDSFGNIFWKTAKDLSKGDLVAIAKTLPEGKSFRFDYLKDFDSETWILTKKGMLKKSDFKGAQKDVMGLKVSSRRKTLNEREFIMLPSKSSLGLLRFLGLMYSEGTLQYDGLQFANNEQCLKQEFASLAKKIFGINAKIKKNKVFCYSAALRNFFQRTLKFPFGKKGNYSLPAWIFGLTKKETAEFVAGFFEGDGTASKGTGGYPTVRIYSITKNVLEDLSVLCRKMGIITKIEPWKTKFSNMLALTVIGNRPREIFAEEIKSNTKKFKIVESWYGSRVKTGDDLRVPDISPLLKQVKNNKNYVYGKNLPEGPTERYISGRDYLTQRKIEEISKLMPDKKLKELATAEISWAKIDSINDTGEQELFDLTIEPHSNFLAAPSLFVMHNSKFVGEAEERVRQIFKEAEENAPSIIFIDEIDAIAPKREEVLGEVERRVVAQILALMDGLEARGGVVVIAATNRVNSIDEALRRPGRFDREVELPVPDKKARKQILQIHTRGMPLADDVDLDYFANITHGFVGADLAALVKEAAMKSLGKYLPEMNLDDETIPPELLEKLQVNNNDFLDGLKLVQPSALREITIDIPSVKWEDIGGLDEIKEELKQAVEWPLKHPDAFKKMGIKPPKGILIYGPPGCGKTLLAKAVATESEANFISIKGPELVSMWVGQTELGIRKIFKKARQVAPSIIFFDEIDSIAGIRGVDNDSGFTRRIVNQLLTELDGIQELNNVVFIAATNMPWLLDHALLRAGRIDKAIRIESPNEATRLAILKVHTSGIKLAKDVSLEDLAKKTENFTGAGIRGLIYEAALLALTEKVDKKTRLKMLKEALAGFEVDAVFPLEDIAEKINGFSKEAIQKLCDDFLVFKRQNDAKKISATQISGLIYTVLKSSKITPVPKPIEKAHLEEIIARMLKADKAIKEKEKVYDDFEENIDNFNYVG
ncbi:MAG TPA: AAA family ATPase [archaeon]|nr:AAA family ATPase [archaeon]